MCGRKSLMTHLGPKIICIVKCGTIFLQNVMQVRYDVFRDVLKKISIETSSAEKMFWLTDHFLMWGLTLVKWDGKCNVSL